MTDKNAVPVPVREAGKEPPPSRQQVVDNLRDLLKRRADVKPNKK